MDKILTLAEAANSLNIPESTLRFWVHKEKAPRSARIGRRRYFREVDVEAFKAKAFQQQGGSAA